MPPLTAFHPFDSLSEGDRQQIAQSVVLKVVEPRQEFVRQGEMARSAHFVLSGQTCRSKILPDGERQIIGFLVPGDSCDLHGCLIRKMDHSVIALTSCTLAEIPRETILRWMDEWPKIARALLAIKIADEMILREWLVNTGARSATKRVAHLLCEMFLRLRARGLGDQAGFEFPITQEELGQAVGLSAVHINRTLQAFKSDMIVSWHRQHVVVHDPERLSEVAGFDASYLQPLQ